LYKDIFLPAWLGSLLSHSASFPLLADTTNIKEVLLFPAMKPDESKRD